MDALYCFLVLMIQSRELLQSDDKAFLAELVNCDFAGILLLRAVFVEGLITMGFLAIYLRFEVI